MCYNRYFLSDVDFSEPINTFGENKTCLFWKDVISGYKEPARWKYEPLDLAEASLADSQNYCRVLGAYPHLPVCFGSRPKANEDNSYQNLMTAPREYLHPCVVDICPVYRKHRCSCSLQSCSPFWMPFVCFYLILHKFKIICQSKITTVNQNVIKGLWLQVSIGL